MADNDWIDWTGGECPSAAATEVHLRDGRVLPCDYVAECLRWSHDGSPEDIIAYRVVPA